MVQQRRNRLVMGVLAVPFGVAMALMLALLEYAFYDSWDPFDLGRSAMVLFAVGEMIFAAVTSEQMEKWWGQITSHADRRDGKVAPTSTFLMAAMATIVPLTWTTLTGAETGKWRILHVILVGIGVVMLMRHG